MARVILEPMTEAQFICFMEAILPSYAAERAAADHVWLETAEQYTDDALARVAVRALVYAAEKDDLTRILVKGAGHFSFITSFPTALGSSPVRARETRTASIATRSIR